MSLTKWHCGRRNQSVYSQLLCISLDDREGYFFVNKRRPEECLLSSLAQPTLNFIIKMFNEYKDIKYSL